MDFAETLEVLKGLPGRTVEVGVSIPDDGGESLMLASFSGLVERVTKSSRGSNMPHLWYVWFAKDGRSKPNDGVFMLREEAFEDATVSGSGRSLEDVIEEDDETMGTTWDITIRQLGVITALTVYV